MRRSWCAQWPNLGPAAAWGISSLPLHKSFHAFATCDARFSWAPGQKVWNYHYNNKNWFFSPLVWMYQLIWKPESQLDFVYTKLSRSVPKSENYREAAVNCDWVADDLHLKLLIEYLPRKRSMENANWLCACCWSGYTKNEWIGFISLLVELDKSRVNGESQR